MDIDKQRQLSGIALEEFVGAADLDNEALEGAEKDGASVEVVFNAIPTNG